jgi:hypothetical protein
MSPFSISDTDPNTPRAAAAASRSHGAAIVALIALAAIGAAWLGMMRTPPAGVRVDVAVVSAGALVIVLASAVLVAALIAYLRDIDGMNAFELFGRIVIGLLLPIGVIVQMLWLVGLLYLAATMLQGVGVWILRLTGLV